MTERERILREMVEILTDRIVLNGQEADGLHRMRATASAELREFEIAKERKGTA